jgi:hypothetical protein
MAISDERVLVRLYLAAQTLRVQIKNRGTARRRRRELHRSSGRDFGLGLLGRVARALGCEMGVAG